MYLYASFVSPFKLDSSTLSSPSIIIPSAGILSPVSNLTISPTTISSIEVSINLPSLFTLHFILDDSSCKCSKAFSLPYSEIVEIKLDKKTAIKIPNVSNQSKSLNKKIVLIISAVSKILMIGSPNVSTNCIRKDFFFLLVRVFVPYFFLDLITSSLLRPFVFNIKRPPT